MHALHSHPSPDFARAAAEIIAIGRFLDHKGWAPATSGNYSVKLADGAIAITVSGREKGALTEADVMIVDANGKAKDSRKPSAETLLHVGIYRRYPACGAVLHTHSENSVVFTKRYPALTELRFEDYEIMKAYPGVSTHAGAIALPIIDNTQDMPLMASIIAPRLTAETPAYLIRGHGLYGWGGNMAEAKRVVEATEFMLACELALRRE